PRGHRHGDPLLADRRDDVLVVGKPCFPHRPPSSAQPTDSSLPGLPAGKAGLRPPRVLHGGLRSRRRSMPVPALVRRLVSRLENDPREVLRSARLLDDLQDLERSPALARKELHGTFVQDEEFVAALCWKEAPPSFD